MQNVIDVLEINKILEMTANLASTNEGKEVALSGKIFKKEELEKEFSYLRELDLAIAYKGQISFIGFGNTFPIPRKVLLYLLNLFLISIRQLKMESLYLALFLLCLEMNSLC